MARVEAMDQLAMRVLEAAGIPARPPIPLEDLARRLGVDEIVEAPMVEDGRLERRAGRTVVFLRRDVWSNRRRFTLGHELGHLVLAGPGKDLIAQRTWPGIDGEERFCDEFAAALLLPRTWITERFGDSPERLGVVRELAGAADASLSASLVRLREVAGWRRSLLHWRLCEDRWRLISTAGVPGRLHNRLTSTPATRAALDELARSGWEASLELPLAVDRQPAAVSVEISVTRRSAVALAKL